MSSLKVTVTSVKELDDRNHFAYIDAIAMGCFVALLFAHFELKRVFKLVSLTFGSGLLIFILSTLLVCKADIQQIFRTG